MSDFLVGPGRNVCSDKFACRLCLLFGPAQNILSGNDDIIRHFTQEALHPDGFALEGIPVARPAKNCFKFHGTFSKEFITFL